jgi:hypothetical protein
VSRMLNQAEDVEFLGFHVNDEFAVAGDEEAGTDSNSLPLASETTSSITAGRALLASALRSMDPASAPTRPAKNRLVADNHAQVRAFMPVMIFELTCQSNLAQSAAWGTRPATTAVTKSLCVLVPWW